ncbi:MAG: hypothetical protein JW704_03680 [Anaerolineaceae bacterium]|nr:hypothetical protein [Anaerolineaceae bacterium]
MSLLAEEIVEEWLNRKGYFTIRGIRLGVQEIDLLAIGFVNDEVICRHVEVQASTSPMSYLIPLPKAIQKESGRGPHNAKTRTEDELRAGAEEWITNKFHHEKKEKLRSKLYPGKWSLEIIIHHLKYEEELKYIEERGIIIHRLDDIIDEMANNEMVVPRASGSDLLDLIQLGNHNLL